MAKITWGADLYKGVTLKDNPGMMRLADFAPYQMLEEKEKSKEWLIAITDHYEAMGWRNVDKKAHAMQRNYWFRQGILNPNDYLINPKNEKLNHSMHEVGLDSGKSPLQKFYPIIPVYVDLMRGDFIKRDNTFSVTQVDTNGVAESLQFKEDSIQESLQKLAIATKEKYLAQMGLSKEDPNPQAQQQYQQAIQEAVQTFNSTEAKFKNFRTIGAKWAQKVIKIHEERYNLSELEPDAFECGLITDSEFWHLDMMEDDFRLEVLNPKFCDYHKGPNIKYVSDGDYFLWFDWGSSGDIINKYGKIMSEADIEKLKTTYASVLNSIVVPDHEKGMQGAYYDTRVPYKQASDLNPAMNDAILGKELAHNFSQNSNFSHSMFDSAGYNSLGGAPQMFRIMNLYFRGMKKIGLLTKIGEDGSLEYSDWVDENFIVTIEPKYDNSIVKSKTKKNVIYGEHVDWTWVNDWRKVIKISADTRHSFWKSNPDFKEIYLDGAPIKFQFKGQNNPYESKPPVEGCNFSWINSNPYSFVDRLESYQVLFNIAMNKVPRNFMEDKGMKLAINQGIIPRNTMDLEQGNNPIEVFEQNLDGSPLLPYNLTREHLDLGMGQPALPQMINLSTVQTAQYYMTLAQQIKMESGEVVGITRNRMGQATPSETAYNGQQNVQYSESQTEKYFENHYNLMKRVRQRMLDAAQYYSTFKENSQEIYLNDKMENEFLQIEGMKNLLPHYQINLESTSKNRSLLSLISNFLVQENTLPFKPAEKIKALVSNSIPKIIELVEKTEIEAELKAQEQQKYEADQAKQAQDSAERIAQQEIEYKDRHDDKANETAVHVAELRALGGVQTDNNKDGSLDAKTNLDAYMREREMNSARDFKNKELLQKESQQTNEFFLKNKETDARILDSQIKLKVAKENKTNAEIKAKK